MENYRSLARMLDVGSGTFLHDMSMEPGFDCFISGVNSNYVVLAARCGPDESKLCVYDLQCLKETGTVPTHLLTSIYLDCYLHAMKMNETRIVCLSNESMHVVDLKPIERLRCPDSG